MATTFTWRILGIKANPDIDGYVDVVTWVQWQCYGTEIDGDPENPTFVGYAEDEGSLDMQFNPDQQFIPMYELTDEIVLNWVWASGVNKELVEADVQAKIDAQKTAGQSVTA